MGEMGPCLAARRGEMVINKTLRDGQPDQTRRDDNVEDEAHAAASGTCLLACQKDLQEKTPRGRQERRCPRTKTPRGPTPGNAFFRPMKTPVDVVPIALGE
jgi:hypothetical protein